MKLGAIVTGHGEVHAVPILVRRIAEILGVESPDIPRPFRVPEGKLKKVVELERAVRFVASQLEPEGGGILILLDSDDECPAKEAPQLLASARLSVPLNVRLEVAMAKCEYEAWFLAAAASIAGKRTLPRDLQPPADAEGIRDAKGWLGSRMKRGYSETLDQPAFSALFDLTAARSNSRSFDKLMRAVTTLLCRAA